MIILENTDIDIIIDGSKKIISENHIPNPLLENGGIPNGFASSDENFNYWLNTICNK